MLVAIKKYKSLSAIKLHQGILKFFAYTATILMVWVIQEMIKASVSLHIPLLAVYATYQCVTEMSSITRHMIELGIKLPSLFIKILVDSKNKIDNKIDELIKPNTMESLDGSNDTEVPQQNLSVSEYDEELHIVPDDDETLKK